MASVHTEADLTHTQKAIPILTRSTNTLKVVQKMKYTSLQQAKRSKKLQKQQAINDKYISNWYMYT